MPDTIICTVDKAKKRQYACPCGAYISVSDVFLGGPIICDWPAVIIFLGEAEKPCILELMDDRLYEEIEELRLVLGTPQSNSPFGAAIGEQNETLIRIRDDADSKQSFIMHSFQLGTEIHLC